MYRNSKGFNHVQPTYWTMWVYRSSTFHRSLPCLTLDQEHGLTYLNSEPWKGAASIARALRNLLHPFRRPRFLRHGPSCFSGNSLGMVTSTPVPFTNTWTQWHGFFLATLGSQTQAHHFKLPDLCSLKKVCDFDEFTGHLRRTSEDYEKYVDKIEKRTWKTETERQIQGSIQEIRVKSSAKPLHRHHNDRQAHAMPQLLNCSAKTHETIKDLLNPRLCRAWLWVCIISMHCSGRSSFTSLTLLEVP